MDDLIAFLRARLDEDERVARQLMAEPGGAYLDPETPGVNIMSLGAHMLRWSPKRVLAEVEAKRRILDERPTGAQFPDFEGGYESAWDDVIVLLALPYASHPDYRDEWRP